MTSIHIIAAARPNFMKVAPLYHALVREDWCEAAIVHTGQHYDVNMSDAFFRDLRLPEPHFHLGVGSGSNLCRCLLFQSLALVGELLKRDGGAHGVGIAATDFRQRRRLGSLETPPACHGPAADPHQ